MTAYAYGIQPWQVSFEDSDGAENSFVAVAATMSPTATEGEVSVMLQHLLVDRFSMATRRETREVPGHELVIAKGGHKLATAQPGGELPPLPWWFGAKPSAAFEGRTVTSMEGPGALAITGRGVPLSELARELSDTLGGPVLDGTGLTGRYYFGVRFANPADLRPGVDVASAPAALQDDLGLRLENRKVNTDFLIVAKFNRQPAEN